MGATSEFSGPVTIGDNVSVGHGAVLKGCTVGDNVLIGMNSIISEHAEVGRRGLPATASFDSVVAHRWHWNHTGVNACLRQGRGGAGTWPWCLGQRPPTGLASLWPGAAN